MIGMTSKQYLVSVKLIFFSVKKSFTFFFFFNVLSQSMCSSFPVTLTTVRLNGEHQKAAAFTRHYEKSPQQAGVITVSLIIA